MYSSCTHHALTMHLPCTYHAPTMHSPCTMHLPCTYHALTMHHAPTMHLPCTHHALTMHSPCTYHAPTMHLPRTHHALTMHSPRTYHALTMHSPCTYHALTSDPYSSQVSEEFATISAARLLTAQNCWERILFGPRSYQLERIVARQVSRPNGRVRAPWLSRGSTSHGGQGGRHTRHACTCHASTSRR